MKLQSVLFAVACTCAVLSAPAAALGVVDASAKQAAGKAPVNSQQAAARPRAAQSDGELGYEAVALVVAAMVLAARSIGRRLQ